LRAISYLHPPIVEAVIELRFAEAMSKDIVSKVVRKFGKTYPFTDAEEGLNVQVDVAKQSATTSPEWSGTRLSSSDRADITIIRTQSFVVSRLAPYSGWEQFQERAKRDWSIAGAAIGRKIINRVGVRYINRLDIPGGAEQEVQIEDYLQVSLFLPKLDWLPISGYAIQVNRALAEGGYMITINSGTVPSPLVGHRSLALDIDLYIERDIPSKEDELWELIDSMRNHKNRVFEACITDQARALFNQ
jgi:uncharacterized protein (TIGR04255 family)